MIEGVVHPRDIIESWGYDYEAYCIAALKNQGRTFMSQLDEMGDALFELLKTEAIDLLDADDRAAALEFFKKKTKQVVQEGYRSVAASSDDEKARAKTNIDHIYAQVEGEVARLLIKTAKKDVVAKLLKAVIGTVRQLAPLIFGAPPTA